MQKLLKELPLDIKYIAYPVVYIILGIATYTFLRHIINNVFERSKNKIKKDRHYQKRMDTLRIMIINIIKYITIILEILAILTIFGINIKSIVAGIGISAAILGLAFQDIAKDLLAGIFIIAEDQYEIGDTIEVNGFMGEVVFIGLKTTRIRDFKGRTKIIANHNITEVINYNLHDSLAVVDVSVDYQEDNEKVLEVLNNLAIELKTKIKKSKGDVRVLGIESLDDSAVIYRVVVPVAPMEQYEAQRILRYEIKKALENNNIKIPFPQIEVHNNGK
ncbi:MAG: mechanosensitive ion channel family protein [Bacilli bacterium]|nr:mechanosensitive ion channel family protein [Bacilli bacterium]